MFYWKDNPLCRYLDILQMRWNIWYDLISEGTVVSLKVSGLPNCAKLDHKAIYRRRSEHTEQDRRDSNSRTTQQLSSKHLFRHLAAPLRLICSAAHSIRGLALEIPWSFL